jgi:hypothetical protein
MSLSITRHPLIRWAAIIILAICAARSDARPIKHTTVDMIADAPVLALARVESVSRYQADTTIVHLYRGALPLGTCPMSIDPSFEASPFLCLAGDVILVGLQTDGTLWSPMSADANIAVQDSKHLDELLRIVDRVKPRELSPLTRTQAFESLLDAFPRMPTIDQTLLLQILNDPHPTPRVEHHKALIDHAIESDNEQVHHLGLAYIRKSHLIHDYRHHLVERLRSPSSPIRAISFSLLSTLRIDPSEYDPKRSPESQEDIIQGWERWVQLQP